MNNLDEKRRPIIQDVASTAFTTKMYTTSMFTLGEEMSTVPTSEDRGPPFLVVVDIEKGASDTNSHYHPDFSFLMWPTGSYVIAGTVYPAGTVMMTEPGAETGECGPGPEGCTELAFYPSTWSGVPFFLDPEDQRGAQMIIDMGDVAASYKLITPPGSVPGASFRLLDRDKHSVKAKGLTAFPCQLGDKGFGTVPSGDDPRPYAILVEFEAGAYFPPHVHAGWIAVTVIDGPISIDGELRSKEVIVAYPPGTPVSLQVGNEKARAIFYCESGNAALPIFADGSVAGAEAVQAVFGKA